MANSKSVFWSAQGTGWLFFLSLLLLYNFAKENLSWQDFFSALLICSLGFLISSGMRWVFVRFHWHLRPLKSIILKVIGSALLGALIYHILITLLSNYILGYSNAGLSGNYSEQLQTVLNWAFLLLFWALMFFTANYFLSYRTEQIKSAQLEAENKMFEVQQLKSQLNPHFLFNALNSIKALVLENPNEARNAINKLSNLLRRTLSTSGEQLITINEEISLVESYLSLEKIRFEERLNFNIQPCERCLEHKIPPLMLQTLVENAVKHGIDKRTEGGTITITMEERPAAIKISIQNPGEIQNKTTELGIGLQNTRRRLRLIYGDQAKLKLINNDNGVFCTIKLPKQ